MGGGGGGGAARQQQLFATLIRTHHVTSRKKLARVRKAAAQLAVPYVLVRSGGSPGLMYAEARARDDPGALAAWVAAVQALRYKDFQCPCKPGPVVVVVPATHHPQQEREEDAKTGGGGEDGGFDEVASVAEFAQRMESKGLGRWWRVGMGYSSAGN